MGSVALSCRITCELVHTVSTLPSDLGVPNPSGSCLWQSSPLRLTKLIKERKLSPKQGSSRTARHHAISGLCAYALSADFRISWWIDGVPHHPWTRRRSYRQTSPLSKYRANVRCRFGRLIQSPSTFSADGFLRRFHLDKAGARPGDGSSPPGRFAILTDANQR